MAEDVAPKLLEEINNTFNGKVKTDPLIKSLKKNAQDGKAILKDAYTYTTRISKHATDSVVLVLRADNLPDGKLYWNIAERTILPFFRAVHEQIIDYAVSATECEDKKIGIGLKPIRPAFNEERLKTVLNALVNYSLEDDA